MGRIAAPFGVQGWVRVRPSTAAVSSLLDYPQWWVGGEGDWQLCAVAEAKVQGRAVIARLEGCGNRESAAALRGRLVAVPRAALPRARENEYYWADLIGLKAVALDGKLLGKIIEIRELPAHPMLVIRPEGTTQDQDREDVWVPLVPQRLKAVDLAGGVATVDWDLNWLVGD